MKDFYIAFRENAYEHANARFGHRHREFEIETWVI